MHAVKSIFLFLEKVPEKAKPAIEKALSNSIENKVKVGAQENVEEKAREETERSQKMRESIKKKINEGQIETHKGSAEIKEKLFESNISGDATAAAIAPLGKIAETKGHMEKGNEIEEKTATKTAQNEILPLLVPEAKVKNPLP